MRKIMKKAVVLVLSGSLLSTMLLPSTNRNMVVVAQTETAFELFHDQGSGYISDIEPTVNDSVTLYLRADKGIVTRAVIQYTTDGSTWKELSMSKESTDLTGYYDMWKGTVPAMQAQYYYRFYVEGSKGNYYYSPGTMSEKAPAYTTCFSVIPGFFTPEWAKGILWYSVLPDAFYNGNVLNDVTETQANKTIPWGECVQGLNEYYGGDIEGISSKIQYIKGLGAEAVYMNPMWTSDSNAGYGPNNYYETAPNYGNEEELAALCDALHDADLKVMLDAVFSYSTLNSIYANYRNHQPLDGAFQSQNSEYFTMFQFANWPDTYTKLWGGIENNLGSDLTRQLLWQAEDSVLKRYLQEPYSIDGWRFDAVADYAGTDTTLTEIAADIRQHVKAQYPSTVLVAEDYLTDEIMAGNWDATQNSWLAITERNWFSGTWDQEYLAERIHQMMRIPRSVGLCMNNYYDNHDYERLATDYETERSRLKAVQLLNMTCVGSPCIYYGDEVGMENESERSVSQKRNSFNWNTNEWDYETYSLYHALGDLRKTYSALRQGVQKIGLTDNDRDITVMGRWDANGSVVTMLNQKDEAQVVTLNLKQYNIKDGIVTDYLTGQTYNVSNGQATVTIPAGGSILVTGKAGNYRGQMEVVDDMAADNIVMSQEGTYTLFGTCGVEGSAGNAAGLVPVSGCGYVEADIVASAEGAALVLRNGKNGKQLTAVFGNGVVTVYDLEQNLLCESTLPEAGKVRVQATADGLAAVYIGTAQDDNLSYAVIEASKVTLEHSDKLYVGISPCSRSGAVLSGVRFGTEDAAIYDDFNESHLGRLLATDLANDCTYHVSDGKFTTNGTLTGLFLSEEQTADFTFKTNLTEVQNGFAGVVSYCDEQNAVALVRDTKDTDSLVFGYLKNGALIPYETVAGDFSSGVVLQIQRIGTTYTATYIYDGVAKNFSVPLSANFSVARVGLVCGSSAVAAFDYACFGDSINDKSSVNTPITAVDVITDMKASNTERTLETYEIFGDSAEWEYAVGGIRRNGTSGLAQLGVSNKKYDDFKIQCTLLPDSSDGEVGVTMLRSSMDTTLGDGYILSLANQTLSVKQGGKIVLSATVDVGEYGLKLTLIRSRSNIYIYIGTDAELFTCVENVSIKEGYIGFYLKDTAGHINNYAVADYNTLWLEPISPYAQNFKKDGNGLRVQTESLAMANLRAVAFTSAEVFGDVVLNPVDTVADAYAGYLFGASQNTEPQNGGVLIALDNTGRIVISKKGEIQKSVSLGTETTSVYLRVTVDKGRYAVYVDGMEKPSLVWKDNSYNGGVVSLVSKNSQGGFYRLRMKDRTSEVVEGEPVYDEQTDVLYETEETLIVPANSKAAIATSLEADADYYITMNVKSSSTVNFSGRDGGCYVNVSNGGYLVNTADNKTVVPWTTDANPYRQLTGTAGLQVTMHSTATRLQVWMDGQEIIDIDVDEAGVAQPTLVWSFANEVTISGIQIWTQGMEEPVYDPNYDQLYTVTGAGNNGYAGGTLTVAANGSSTILSNVPKDSDYYYTMTVKSMGGINLTSRVGGYYIHFGNGGYQVNDAKNQVILPWTTDSEISKKLRGEGLKVTVHSGKNVLQVWADGRMIFNESVRSFGNAQPGIAMAIGQDMTASDICIWVKSKEPVYNALTDTLYRPYGMGDSIIIPAEGSATILSDLPENAEYYYTMTLKGTGALNLRSREGDSFVNMNSDGYRFYAGSGDATSIWIDESANLSKMKTTGLRVTVHSGRNVLRIWMDGHLIVDEKVSENGKARPEIAKAMGQDLEVSNIRIWTKGGWYDVSTYRKLSGNYTYPTKEGYVFAGWYTSDTVFDFDTTLPEYVTTGEAYALFVDENVLSVKWQISADTNRKSKTTNLRLITTVDSLRYQNVGFSILYDGKQFGADRLTNVVYEQIAGWEDGSVQNYFPTEFSSESLYFMSYRINKIPQSAFYTDFKVTPFWTTLDGTKVKGNANTFQIGDDALLQGGMEEVNPDEEQEENFPFN